MQSTEHREVSSRRRSRWRWSSLACALALTASSCGSGDGESSSGGGGVGRDSGSTPAPVGALAPSSARERDELEPPGDLYASPDRWLCLPGSKESLCTTGLDATIVRADGSVEIERHQVAASPSFDCFYVYPTVSRDRRANSDLEPGPEEQAVVRVQAARLSSVCRVFAPLYRQRTLPALMGMVEFDEEKTLDLAYRDTRAAFRHYLQDQNDGRGFLLFGHSQGSQMLERLIREEIDPDAKLRGRLIAAYLLGTRIALPDDADLGGTFAHVPPCRDDDQVGCFVSYATFRATAPPPPNSLYGRVPVGRAACENPAALAGGPALLSPYFSTASQAAYAPGTTAADVETPFIKLPDFLRAECVEENGFRYLKLWVLADPRDPRVDDIGGDSTPQRGLHRVDVNVAMGDLVSLASRQARAYGERVGR